MPSGRAILNTKHYSSSNRPSITPKHSLLNKHINPCAMLHLSTLSRRSNTAAMLSALVLASRNLCQSGITRNKRMLRNALVVQHFPSQQSGSDTLWAIRRKDKSQNTASRQAGMLVGCISGLDPLTGREINELIYLRKKQIWGIISAIGKRCFMCRVYDMEIHEGPQSDKVIDRFKVCPRKIFFLEGHRKILNMAFVKVRPDVKLKLHIPLKFSGRRNCPGLNDGGSLRVLKTGVSCYCFPDQIPSYIEVNVGKLRIGDIILVRDLNVHLQFECQEPEIVCDIIKKGLNAIR